MLDERVRQRLGERMLVSRAVSEQHLADAIELGRRIRDGLGVLAGNQHMDVAADGFGGGQRPNRTGTSAEQDGSAQSRLNAWFNTAAFTLPASFTFGNAARTMPDARSHGIANYDFTIFKNTKITESVGLQFRTEIFNLFNRVRFAYPGTALGNPQFGVVSGQYNDPRLVQFALRLSF